jgi:crotonobetainyl-CoA:carnitine CoA-transferase CaiB-like acyl-CoA transferase
MSAKQGPLNGVRVLSLGHWIAGPYAATLLGDLGADVTRVVERGSRPPRDGMNAVLTRGAARIHELELRRPADAENVRELVNQTDVLIENFRPGVLANFGLDPRRLATEHPQLIVLSLPGFASDDPRASLPGWEAVVMGAAGAYGAASGEMLGGEWWPQGDGFTPLPLASVFAAVLGALGVTAALVEREQSGLGQLVEVPLHDAFLEAIGSRGARYERPARNWTFLGSGFYRCADDTYVSLITVWHRHLRWFLAALGWSPSRIEHEAGYDTLMTSSDARERLRYELTTVLATAPAEHWEQLGMAAGVPIARLRTSREWLERQESVSSDSIQGEAGSADREWIPGPPIRIRPTASGAPLRLQDRDRSRQGPLAGCRILDMTRVLAGPTASRLLADLGADVVRADVDPAQLEAGNREPFFHEVVNRGKHVAEVDVGRPGGRDRIESLLAWADVLITNFTSPALERLRLDPGTLASSHPDVVHTWVTSFDEHSEWSHLRGYAEIVNTVTGITAETIRTPIPSGVAPNVDLPRMPFTDHLGGAFAALGSVAAVFDRVRAGSGQRVVTALVDAAYAAQLPFIGDAWAGWRARAEPGLPGWSGSHRMIRVADGWVVIGLTDAALARLVRVIGRDALDRVESAAVLAMQADEVIDAVIAAGGSAHRVVGMDALTGEGGLLDRRGLIVGFDSPEYGRITQLGLPIRYSRTPGRPGGHPDAGDAWLLEHVGITARQRAASVTVRA